MQLHQVAVSVLVKGRRLAEYQLDGRTYVPGSPETEYTIRIVSRSPRRLKAVISVDGLNVIDGRPAELGGPGYILDPWSAMDLPGWRVSDLEVAKFVFRSPDTSYASAAGKAENVGVIGAAFFEEVDAARDVLTAMTTAGPAVHRPVPTGPTKRGTALTGAQGGSLGTGFGAKTDHAVRKVEFEARSAPVTTLTIRYEDAAILRGLGVPVEDDTPAIHAPVAFPAAGYCHPPAGWRG